MIIAGTGHRPHKLNNEYEYQGPLSKWIMDQTREVLLAKAPERIISGMAIGYDTMLALVALELKIPLLAAIPFVGQETRWPKSSRDLFNKILSDRLTISHVVCEGGYAGWKFIKRDHYMVDNGDEVIACYNGDLQGGTWQTWKYAVQKQKPITIINPLNYEPTLAKST